jgi:NAD(P)-dependent dehydrogenase (short-subunit alcohol dehydrogenase family)
VIDGHVSLITGGNSGIGLGMARGLVAAGADVAIWGTNEEKNKRAVEELSASGRRVVAFRCDVSDEAQVVESFAATAEAMGKVDSVFANAGLGGVRTRPFAEMTLDEWRSMMAVNLDGAFLTLREGTRHLVERGEGGALIGVSSTSAIHGAPRNQHYAAAKTALLAVMRGLAVELARHQIRCNALVPGWTETPMTEKSRTHEKFVANTTARTPVRRWGTPDDFAAVAVFLADPAQRFHTGDTIVVDGGYTVF